MLDWVDTATVVFARQSAGRWVLACWLAATLSVACSQSAKAQYIANYFPVGVPGYGTSEGVTVLSRVQPLYQSQGIDAGGFTIRPGLDESFGYDTQPSGTNLSRASTILQTSPIVTATSNWSTNALAVGLSADDHRYFNVPNENYTNWQATIGGGYTIGLSNLDLGYSHLALNQTAVEIGAVDSDRPVKYAVDDIRSDYTFHLGRLLLTPSIDVQKLNFEDTTVLGQQVSQAYRNRVVVLGGMALNYSLSDQRNLVFILQGVDSSFTDEPSGLPSNDSTSVRALGGIDYQADGPWTYRLLIGVEERTFSASQYAAHVAPVASAEVVWTPSGLTTVTGSLTRTIEDPEAEGSSGYTFTTTKIVLDHELLRNVRLQLRGGVQLAEYLQGGGNQTSYSVGTGVNWLLNRNVRLSLNYNFATRTGSQATSYNGVENPTTVNNASLSRSVVLLGLHLAL